MKRLDPIAVPLGGTTLIEASAGTGKTYTIALLFLRLLLERELDVAQILVVTYTRAATAELRERIRTRLFEAVTAIDRPGLDADLDALIAERRKQGELERDRGRLLLALRDFDRASILTIHAFCQQTLADCAFESSAPFTLELSDDQKPLLREVVLDYWARSTYGADRELAIGLRGQSLPQLEQLAAKAVRDPRMPVLPDVPDESVPAREAFETARAQAARLWNAERGVILAQLHGARLNRNSYSPDRFERWAAELDGLAGAEPFELPKCVRKFSPSELAKAKTKDGTTPRHPFFEAAQALLAAADERTRAVERRVLATRRRLCDYARAEVPRRRRERGVHGFDDLLHQLGDALQGAAGAALARRVRERHPAALIDEFQDTDPVQYGIFRRIYAGTGSLFLIGDPKQAIYGFRGADVFAYMQAVRLAGDSVHTLGVNYRTDPGLLHAIETLFGRTQRPFLFPEIRLPPLRAKPDARERLTPLGPALQLLFVPRGPETQEKKLSADWGATQLPRYAAYEIAHLLHEGATIDGTPVQPRHIAVLCRTNAQAKDTRHALAELGVPTVLEGDSSVFDSETADELARVLWAIAEPADGRKLGSALATAIFGADGETLHRLRGEDSGLELWLDRFARWNQLWHERGFVPMVHKLIEEAEVQPRLLARSNGERRLTDLLHLIELLHQASAQQHLGPLSLMHWFSQLRSDPDARSAEIAAESEQMRLEHDEHAVRLTTVHRSKGLEYPIVFCPFMWKAFNGLGPEVRFHDRADSDRLKLDLGSANLAQHEREAEREELAESLRLLYVALTRAKHRCYVVWGRFYNSGASPLGYLLHGQAASDTHPQAVEDRMNGLADADLRAELATLCEAASGSIAVRDLRLDPPVRYVVAEPARAALVARTPRRTHPPFARMTSFSRLTAEAALGAAPAHAAELPDHDAGAPEGSSARPQPDATAAAAVVMHAFPSGSRPGSLIHAVYEHIDFQRADPAQLGAQADRFLALYGVDGAQHRDALVRGIEQSLLTPLDAAEPPLTLAAIARAQRVNELEFTLCTRGRPQRLGERIADAFARHAAPACDPDYAERLRALGFVPPADFLKGFMDLVFQHAGRFYVADYKSNRLGDRAADYAPDRLVRSMREHHYFLQYHLYVLALHRYLSLRVADYDYERHFGGVYYLYLRGMAPEHARGTGVFFDRPGRALIEALGEALGAPEAPP